MKTQAAIVVSLAIGVTLSGCQAAKLPESETTIPIVAVQTQTITKPVATDLPATKPSVPVGSATNASTIPPATKPPVASATNGSTVPPATSTSAEQASYEWARDIFTKSYEKAFYVETDRELKRFVIYPRDEDELEFIISEYETDPEARNTWDAIRTSLIEVSATLSDKLPGYSIIFGNTLNRDKMLLKVMDGEVTYDFADELVAEEPEEPEDPDAIDMVEFAHVAGLKKGLEAAYDVTFDFKKRELYLEPILGGLNLIISLKDSDPDYLRKWEEIVESIRAMSEESADSIPKFKYILLNPDDSSDQELIVQDGKILYDSSDDE